MTTSTPSSQGGPSRRSRGHLRLRIVLIFLATVALLLLAWLRFVDARLENAVSASQASLAFRDYVPDLLREGEANGADFVEAAALMTHGQELVYHPRDGSAETLGSLRDTWLRVRELPLERSVPGPEDLELFRRTVAEERLALEILDEGLRTATAARYQTDYGVLPLEITIPNLYTRWYGAALLRARGEVSLADGDPEAAWEDAVGILRLGHWTAIEMPTLINALFARLVVEEGAHFVQRLLALGPPPAEVPARLLSEARRVDPAALFLHRYDADRASVFSSLVEPRFDVVRHLSGDSSGAGRRLVRWALQGSSWMRLNAAAYAETTKVRRESCLLPTFQREDSFDDEFEALEPPWWAPAARSLDWDCRDLAPKRDLWIATLDQLEIALAVESVRRETGSAPESLDVLPAAADRLDPFTGEPYRYRSSASGYAIWSVSLNRRDDDGALPSADEDGRPDPTTGDHVWQVGFRSSADPDASTN